MRWLPRISVVTTSPPAVGSGVDKIRQYRSGLVQQLFGLGQHQAELRLHGGWETVGPTNFQSALYADSAAPVTGDLAKYNINDAVTAFIAAGMPKSKNRGWYSFSTVAAGKA